MSLSKIKCRRKLEKLYSETRDSSARFENIQYGTEKDNTGKNKTNVEGGVQIQEELRYLIRIKQYFSAFLTGIINSIHSHFLSDKSKRHYVPLNWSLACTMLGGQCKTTCGDKEFRMIDCKRPTTICCMRECDPRTY
ncbi:beta-defensin 112 [Camelus bactrianus]|uniref:Beta-defensin 112 n=1 Tax=Camelus bactrianus TaxID=9837 RepID=A0AC58P1X3_CAMBA